MTVRLERVDGRLGIFLTEDEIAELQLRENEPFELRVVKREAVEVELSGRPAPGYVPLDEVLVAYRQTEPRFAEAYRELAKMTPRFLSMEAIQKIHADSIDT